MIRVLLQQAVGLGDEANEQLRGFYERALSRLSTAMEAGQALGIVRPGNSGAMAACMLGMLKESFYQQLLGTQTPTTEDLIEELFSFTARGILVTPQS